MGMFDYISDPTLRCPYCGGFNLELQTKDYDSTLATIQIHEPGFKKQKGKDGKKIPKCFACWHAGIFGPDNEDPKIPVHPTTRVRTIEVTGQCNSPACYCLARMRDYADHGYISGFGRTFELTYRTVKGVAVVPATITERDSDTLTSVRQRFEARLREEKDARKSFEDTQRRMGGDWGLAVLMWHWSAALKGFKVLNPKEAGPATNSKLM